MLCKLSDMSIQANKNTLRYWLIVPVSEGAFSCLLLIAQSLEFCFGQLLSARCGSPQPGDRAGSPGAGWLANLYLRFQDYLH